MKSESRYCLFIILLAFSIFLIMPLVSAKQGHITLLTLIENENESEGGIADLNLEIQPGVGRIFIDSLPLTKLDTQISTRFANEIACNYVDFDCSQYDFFYTIRAGSSIVGGPSAGGAITILTISVLADLPLRNDTVFTGTINSGGLIGPVAGISEKVGAAKIAGFKRVLIPQFELLPKNLSNQTNETGQSIEGIEIVKVSNLDQVMVYFFSKQIKNIPEKINISSDYKKIMQNIAISLCNRTIELNNSLKNNEFNASLFNNSDYKFSRSMESFEKGEYYSTASYCFSANLILRQLQLRNSTNENLFAIKKELKRTIDVFNKNIDSVELKTLSDLETFMIVKERVKDSTDSFNNINDSNISSYELAYSIERYNSAVSWSKLFGLEGRPLNLNQEYLKEACLKKISEAEERINYVNYYVAGLELGSREKLKTAYADYGAGNYAICLFTASKIKAEANLVMSGITIPKDQMHGYVDEKLNATKKIILKEEEKGIFPILGYSYYEYAESLKDADLFSALTFSEYALEMSNLDMYFPKEKLPEKDFYFGFKNEKNYYFMFIYGFIVGFIFCITVVAFAIMKRFSRK